MKFPLEQIRAQLKKLPQEVRDVIGSDELSQSIQSIGKKYALHIDQLGELGNQINYRLLGLISREEFLKNLKQEVKLDNSQISTLATDVENEVFQKIRKSLQEVYPSASSREQEKVALPTQPAEAKVQSSPQTDLSRDHLLKEIETISVPVEPTPRPVASSRPPESKTATPPSNLPTGNIAEARLTRMFNLPKEEKKIESPTVPQAPAQPRQYSTDPYREPPK